MHERADETGVLGGFAGEHLIQPGGDAVEFLVSSGQDAGVHQGLTDVVLVAAGRQLVEQLVAEWPPGGGELGEQGGVGAASEPAQHPAGVLGGGEGLQQRP